MPVIDTVKDGIRQPNELYITPAPVIRAQLAGVPKVGEFKYILDPCAGTGRYGIELRKKYPDAVIVGVELQKAEDLYLVDPNFSENIKNYTLFYSGTSIFDYIPACSDNFDLIITNPPFSLTQILVQWLWKVLNDRGVLSLLNRVELLESRKRFTQLFKNYPLFSVDFSVCRIPWENHPAGKQGKGDYKMYAFYHWVNGHKMPNAFLGNLVAWTDYL